MSPIFDNHSNSNGSPTRSFPGSSRKDLSNINVEEFELTKKLFDKVMELDDSLFDANEVDFEEHVPINLRCYPDGTIALLYMRPPSSPLRNCTHDQKHQKKRAQQVEIDLASS